MDPINLLLILGGILIVLVFGTIITIMNLKI